MRAFSLGMFVGLFSICLAASTNGADQSAKPTSPGQPQAGRGDFDPGARIKEALADLNLNEDQKSKVQEIMARVRQDLEKMREEARSSGGDRREAMRGIMEKLRGATEEISAVLDDQQKAAFREKISQARQRLGSPADMQERIKRALGDLNLSDDQKQKVQALFADAMAKAQEIRSGGGEQMREKLMQVREENIKRMKEVLTEEQFKKFQEAMQAGPGAGGPGGQGMGPMMQKLQRAIKEVDLSDQQKAKLAELMENIRRKAQERREQAKTQADAQEGLRELGEELKTEIQSILTPQQQEQLRNLMSLPTESDPAGRSRGKAPAK